MDEREFRQTYFPDSPATRADRAAERAAELAAKGKTDEALVMVLLAIEARLESVGASIDHVPQ